MQWCNKVRGRLRQRSLRRTGKTAATPGHGEDGEDDLDRQRIPLFSPWLDLVVGAGQRCVEKGEGQPTEMELEGHKATVVVRSRLGDAAAARHNPEGPKGGAGGAPCLLSSSRRRPLPPPSLAPVHLVVSSRRPKFGSGKIEEGWMEREERDGSWLM